MKFKEFVKWCNERASDGCWSFESAYYSIQIINKIKSIPFWKRKRVWEKEEFEKYVTNYIVEPTNELINKYRGDN